MQKSIDVLRRAGRLALRILRSRLTAVSALAAACAMMVTYVTVHMRAVTVVDGDTSRVVMTLSRTPVAVLEDAGVALGGHDVMNVSLDEGLIEISRAFPVSVTVDGMTAILQMTSGTVGDALQLAGVRLGAFDKVNAGLEDAVAPGTSLLVERVKYNEYTKTEPVDYKTTVKYSNSLDRGQSKIIQSGCKGEKTLVYRDCLVDGKVAETILVSESVTTEPVDQIKLVGVGGNMPMSPLPDSVELDGDGIPVHYKQVLTGSAAAYTWYNTPEGQTTSTGRKPQVGNVAVDYPLRLRALHRVCGRQVRLRVRNRVRYRRFGEEGDHHRRPVYGHGGGVPYLRTAGHRDLCTGVSAARPARRCAT